MSNQVYENWWKNLTEGGVYYRDQWYATEQNLNSHGFYLVESKVLYLGEDCKEYKCHGSVYRFKENDYLSYSQLHALGYSEYRSFNKHFINSNTFEYYSGYYNSTDGYYVNYKWYETLSALNSAGYEVGDLKINVYSAVEFKKFTSIVKTESNTKYYYIADSHIGSWITESQFNEYSKSLLPSVDTDWCMGNAYTNGAAHGNHGAYNVNYRDPLKHSNPLTVTEASELFGYAPYDTEYDCCAAWIGDSYSPDGSLIGYKAYLEYSTSYNTLFFSTYPSTNSGAGWNAAYQPIAVVFGKDTEIVTVYDKINSKWNAFKYSLDGVDYYYILDFIQTAWTDDISAVGYSLEPLNGLRQIWTTYGSSVDIPEGYQVQRVVGNNPNIFPSYVGIEEDTGYLVVAFEGKNKYTTHLWPKHIRKSRAINGYIEFPLVCIEQGISIYTGSNPHLQVSQMTGRATSDGLLNLVEVKINGTDPVAGDYFVLIKTTSTGYKSYFESGYPARFWYITDIDGSAHGTIWDESPQVWSFNQSTNSFSWLGNPNDIYDQSFYSYNDWKNAPSGQHYFGIFIYAPNESDRIQKKDIMDITNGTIQSVEYWPHRGYKFNNRFLNENQLYEIGYHAINYTKQETVYFNGGETYAQYGITNSSTSFDVNSYFIQFSKDGLPVTYDGSCDIVIKENYNNYTVKRLQNMPSNTVSSWPWYCLMSVLTKQSTPKYPLNSSVIGQPLGLMACSNYYSTVTYSLPSSYTLMIDEYKRKQYSTYTAVRLEDEVLVTVYYDNESGYLVKDVGTYSTEAELNSAGYILPDLNVFEVQYDNSYGSLYRNYNITRNSTSFAMSNQYYYRVLYRNSQQLLYDGTQYIWDTNLSDISSIQSESNSIKVNRLSDMSSSTTSSTNNRTDLFLIVSEHGTPLQPFKDEDIGRPLRLYIATNYQTDIMFTTYPRCVLVDKDSSYSYIGIDTFYHISDEYSFNYIMVNNTKYYHIPSIGFLTEQQVLSRGYSKDASEEVLVSDTNIEMNITNVYNALYSSRHGYYINNSWHRTGYYKVQRHSMVVYGTHNGVQFDNRITKYSTNFNTSNKTALYLDSSKTQPFLWDGCNWITDVVATPTIYIENDRGLLSDMPEMITHGSDSKYLLMPITASGTPIHPYVQQELNTQVYLYKATNYYSNYDITYTGYSPLTIYCYKLV